MATDLTQYIFWDGHEQIVNQRRRIIAVRDTQFSEDYLPLKKWPRPYIQASMPTPSSTKFSIPPKVNEYLLTARFLGFRQKVTNSRIREINENFELPEN